MFLSDLLKKLKPHFLIRADLPILKTIGYSEAKDVLNNHLSIDKAIELTSQNDPPPKTKNMVS